MEGTIFASLGHYAAVGALVALGQFVYAALGFGAGMVTLTLLALAYGSLTVYVPFLLLVCIPTEAAIAWRDRAKIEVRRAGALMLFIAPFIVAGTAVLDASPGPVLEAVLGVVIVALALYFLLWEDGIDVDLRRRRWVIGPVGAASGLLGSLFGIGGPPLVFYFKALKLDKGALRASLLTVFLLTALVRVAVYVPFGLFSAPVAVSAAAVLPWSGLALWLGNRAHHRIPEALFRRATSALLLIAGALLAVRGL